MTTTPRATPALSTSSCSWRSPTRAPPTDRGRKSSIYARHDIREYWIVDLRGDRVEVRRRPQGELWGETRLLHRGEEFSPFAFPDFSVPVEAILPPPVRRVSREPL